MKQRLPILLFLVGIFLFLPQPTFAGLGSIPSSRPFDYTGKYETDLFSGSATYSYPIKVPKGTNDLTPNVSLSYNSSSTHSIFSSIGTGWQVDQDYIQRDINFTTANTGDDTFKLTLQGTTYDLVYVTSENRFHTKTESFLHIQKLSSSQNQKGEYWEVKTPDGKKYIFGKVSNTEHLCSGRDYVTQWKLEQIQDTNGNVINYTYSEAEGFSYVHTITYNNSLKHKVYFTYTSIATEAKQLQGCGTIEPYRLVDIQVSTDNNLVRQYDLSFTLGEHTQALLGSITEKGSDGVTALPATTFTYKPEVKSWGALETWINNANIDTHLERPDTGMADVNGDGYLDIVRTENSSGPLVTWKVLFNQDGNSWSTNFQTVINNYPLEGAHLNRSDIRLMDVTGDQLADIVLAPSAGQWWVWRNTGSGWSTTKEDWGDKSSVSNEIHLNNSRVQLMDVTGDKLPDIVRTWWNGSQEWQVFRNTGNNSWHPSPEVWAHGQYGYGLDDADTTMADANGDGLIDIIRTTYTGNNQNSTDTWKVYRNTGSGWAGSEEWIDNANVTAHLGMENIGIADVNGDGLPDIVKVMDYGPSDEWRVLLNKGQSWSTQWETWIPTSAGMDVDFSGEENVKIADVDGDGMADIVESRSNGVNVTWKVARNSAKAPKHIASIKTSQGGTISFDYKRSTSYDNTGPDAQSDLPFPMWLLEKKTENNGMASTQQTNNISVYSYDGGVYNTQAKEFRGFNTVEETLANTIKKKYVFNQDDVLKGKLAEVQTRDNQNNPYAETENTWSSTQTNGYNIVKLDNEKEYTYDGTASNPKISQVDYTYDTYGNISKVSEKGDTSITTDDRFIYNEYTVNTSNWIVNTLRHSYKHAADDSTKIAEKWLYYDDHTWIDDAPTKGNLTKEVNWLSGGTSPTVLYEYDTYGNQTKVTDPNNNVTTFAYDSTGTYRTSTTNAKNQTTTAQYNLGTGNVLSQTDPNGFTTSYVYDALGRITKEIKSYDSTTYPTNQYQYFFDGTAPEGVLASKRESASSSATLDVYTFSDGFGNKIQTRADAEDTSKQIVSDTFYDPNGEVSKQTVPSLSTAVATYSASTATSSATIMSYDILARPIIIENPEGNEKTISYDHWKETTVDENGHIKREYKNAFDKITKVEEVNNMVTYTTSYVYDASDQLKQIIDHLSNSSAISYDTLGRKTSQEDPDMGTWTYEYDGVGNITKQKDNRNVEITKTYDELNRLTKTDYPTNTDVVYTYDGNNKKGTLTTVVDGAGTVNYTYDNRLRKTAEQRTVNGTTKTTQFAYDSADRTVTQTNPDGEDVTYAFNAQGEINSVTGTTGIVNNIDYNALGKITEKSFPNGLSTNYTYNTNNFRLGRIQTGSLQDLNYTYDNVGNIKTIADSVENKTQTFGYDDLDRLVTASESAGYNYTYEYNAIGNLTKYNNGNTETEYTYGEGTAGPHALTSNTGSQGASSSAQTNTFQASEDAHVDASTPTTNYATETALASDGDPVKINYMKFDLASLAGRTVTNAKLRVYVVNESMDTHRVKDVSTNSWAENTVTYNNRPSLHSTVIGTLASPSTNNSWYEIDITSAVASRAGQLYSLAVDSAGTDGMYFSSKDSSTNKEELVITSTSSSGGPTNTPTPTPTTGPTATPTPTGTSQTTAFQATEDTFVDAVNTSTNYGSDTSVSVDGDTVKTGYMKFNLASLAGKTISNAKLRVYVTNGSSDTQRVKDVSTNSWAENTMTYTNRPALNSTVIGTIASTTTTNTWYEIDITSAVASRAGQTYSLGMDSAGADGMAFNSRDASSNKEELLITYSDSSGSTPTPTPTGGAQSSTFNATEDAHVDASSPTTNYATETALGSDGDPAIVNYMKFDLSALAGKTVTNAKLRVHMANGSVDNHRLKDVSTNSWAENTITYNTRPSLNSTVIGTLTSPSNINTWYEVDITSAVASRAGQIYSIGMDSSGTDGGWFYSRNNSTNKEELVITYTDSGGTPTPTPTNGPTATPTPTSGPAQPGTFTYDANGNMLSDGTKCYQYNEANQMDKVRKCDNNQTIAEYVYDYTGLRMVKRNFTSGTLSNTVTSWSDSYETKVIEGGATENTAYYFANGQLISKKDKNGNKTYFHNDHLGSTRLITNQSGGAVESTSYDPWGQVKSGGTKSKFLYTGQEKDDETDLHYYNARYYDSDIRRFTQPDDIVENVYDPQMLNRYTYVRNNPLRYIDPSGQCIFCGALSGALAWFAGTPIGQKVLPPIIRIIPAVTKLFSSPKITPTTTKVSQQVIKQAPANIKMPPPVITNSANTSVKSTPSGNAISSTLKGNSSIKIDQKYTRPSGATTKAMREAVNTPGTTCHTCGKIGEKMVPDHVPSLVEEYYQTGIIDLQRMKSLDSILPQCLTCSRVQGGVLSNYSKKKATELDL